MKRKILRFSLVFCIALGVLIYCCHIWVEKGAETFVYDELTQIPTQKVGLLLGTIRVLPHGQPNAYFFNRIQATVQLYQAGKISAIVISGDNSRKDYNEPEDMKNELLKYGIPDSVIYLDFAGFRTNDSVIRCKEIFGQSSFIIISQRFHNERAVMIARNYQINACGYNAAEVDAYAGLKTNLRELLARVKLVIDLKITHKQPKFLGERVEIK